MSNGGGSQVMGRFKNIQGGVIRHARGHFNFKETFASPFFCFLRLVFDVLVTEADSLNLSITRTLCGIKS